MDESSGFILCVNKPSNSSSKRLGETSDDLESPLTCSGIETSSSTFTKPGGGGECDFALTTGTAGLLDDKGDDAKLLLLIISKGYLSNIGIYFGGELFVWVGLAVGSLAKCRIYRLLQACHVC